MPKSPCRPMDGDRGTPDRAVKPPFDEASATALASDELDNTGRQLPAGTPLLTVPEAASVLAHARVVPRRAPAVAMTPAGCGTHDALTGSTDPLVAVLADLVRHAASVTVDNGDFELPATPDPDG